jgi:hypothetical protein
MAKNYFRITDGIVRSCLTTLPNLAEEDCHKYPVVVGGIAVQLYSEDSPELLRETTDLDLIYPLRFGSFSDFERKVIRSLRPDLARIGYQTQGQRAGKNWAVKVMKGQGRKAQEIFFVNFDYPIPRLEEKEARIIEREINNSVLFEVDGEQIFVKSLEDLIPRKIRRIDDRLRSLEPEQEGFLRSLLIEAERENWRELAKVPLLEWGSIIQTYQERLRQASERGEDLRSKPSAYIASKDLYDICLLSMAIESGKHPFNRTYYSSVKKEIEDLLKKED